MQKRTKIITQFRPDSVQDFNSFISPILTTTNASEQSTLNSQHTGLQIQALTPSK